MFFSKSQRYVQDLMEGRKVADALYKNRVHKELTDSEENFINKCNFFFIASSGLEYIDNSIKCGSSGFVKCLTKSKISWLDFDGNRMYRTIGNIVENKKVSLLFVNFETIDKVKNSDNISVIRIQGLSNVLFRKKKRPKIIVEIKKIIPNCPRYIPKMMIQEESKYLKDDITPEWKKREYIKNIL